MAGVLALTAVLLYLITNPSPVVGNVSQITSPAQTASATSTLVFLRPGAATTTLVYDSQQSDGTNQTNNGNTYLTDEATLLVQFTASSTTSILGIGFEYSNDVGCGAAPTTCDWYKNNLINPLALSTTTTTIGLQTPITYSWTFASSSVGGVGVTSSNNRDTKVISVPTPMRYVRAVFTVSGANGAVYAQFLPKKETK